MRRPRRLGSNGGNHTFSGGGSASARAMGDTARRAMPRLRKDDEILQTMPIYRVCMGDYYARITTDGFGRLLAYLDDGSTTPLPPTAVTSKFALWGDRPA